jgi:8-oxo-dGTP diphosphatase
MTRTTRWHALDTNCTRSMSMNSTQETSVPVAVGVIQRADGCVLLAERPQGKPWAGYWEFPGGKIEAGEDVRTALTRELHEELGIELERGYPWISVDYAYPEKRVRLNFYRVLGWHGTPHGREGQRLSWEDPQLVGVQPLLPANEKILHALRLPTVYGITHAAHAGGAAFLPRLEAALEHGLRLIQVREPEMDTETRQRFARAVVARAHRYGARVLVNADAALARAVGADGVHVPSRQLWQLTAPPDADFWAASCHDAAELARAAELHANFVVLSPVLPTASHPQALGLGWERFAQLVHHYPLPVYALGGMRLESLDTAMSYGAHGIGLMRGVW